MSTGRGEAPRFAGPIEITDRAALDAVYQLRVSVWRQTGKLANGAFRDGSWHDDYDDRSRHWVITRDEEIVAAARLSVHSKLEQVPEAHEYLGVGLRLEGPVAAPDRVVVSPSTRRLGLAGLLLDAQDEAAAGAGAMNAVRQAAPAMRRVLLGRGWRHVAAASIDARFPGVEFQIMTRGYRPERPSAP